MRVKPCLFVVITSLILCLLLMPGCNAIGPKQFKETNNAVSSKKFCPEGHIPVPLGWRRPFPNETTDEWRNRDIGRFLVVTEDFNGDGTIDQAELLLRNDGSKFAPFAYLCKRNGTYSVHQLGEEMDIKFLSAMGIEDVTPGLYLTACGKGYVECGEGEPEEIQIPYHAINFFKEESANSFFYWDAQKKAFRRIWISD